MEKWLSRLDLNTLRKLAGEVVLQAIEDKVKSNLEGELSKVLLYKYGYSILEQKNIRLAIIDSFSQVESERLAAKLGIRYEGKSLIWLITEIQKKFKSFTYNKSLILCDFLGLSEDYHKQNNVDERPSSVSITVKHNEEARLKSYLHPYQKGVKDQALSRLITNSSDSFMVQMPTGSGKTYTAQEVMVDVLRSPNFNKFVVWIVNSNELAEQAFESFQHLWKIKGDKEILLHRMFGKFEPKFTPNNYGAVFIGFDKLNSILTNYEHKHYEETKFLIENTELVIVDEAHKSVAETYNNCIEAFNTYKSKLIGLTATPGRGSVDETLELVDLFSGDIVQIIDENNHPISDPISFLQKEEYLAEIDVELFKTDVAVKESTEGSILETLSKNPSRNSKIIDLIRQANENKESTLVFACSLDHVIALKILCDHENIPVEFIIGSVNQAERLNILQRFKDKEFFILINLDILSTGIDVPNVNKLIITRPVGSSILYSQIVGRALRGVKNGGNHRNTIINLKDNLLNYSDINSLFGKFELEWQGKINYSS
ncbi:DEAD/DEAH box helicase [Balneola sp. MJW-20]|uniref:DEAD/DEAH box helicase n=1 Tax=Gracilimonas aurantiaca TaxID=3234185 RepID=UPI003467CEFE